jgi:hypothetical protein
VPARDGELPGRHVHRDAVRLPAATFTLLASPAASAIAPLVQTQAAVRDDAHRVPGAHREVKTTSLVVRARGWDAFTWLVPARCATPHQCAVRLRGARRCWPGGRSSIVMSAVAFRLHRGGAALGTPRRRPGRTRGGARAQGGPSRDLWRVERRTAPEWGGRRGRCGTRAARQALRASELAATQARSPPSRTRPPLRSGGRESPQGLRAVVAATSVARTHRSGSVARGRAAEVAEGDVGEGEELVRPSRAGARGASRRRLERHAAHLLGEREVAVADGVSPAAMASPRWFR